MNRVCPENLVKLEYLQRKSQKTTHLQSSIVKVNIYSLAVLLFLDLAYFGDLTDTLV